MPQSRATLTAVRILSPTMKDSVYTITNITNHKKILYFCLLIKPTTSVEVESKGPVPIIKQTSNRHNCEPVPATSH